MGFRRRGGDREASLCNHDGAPEEVRDGCVRPYGTIWAKGRDGLQQLSSFPCFVWTVQDGVVECFHRIGTSRASSVSVFGKLGWMHGQVALGGSQLLDPSCDEFAQTLRRGGGRDGVEIASKKGRASLVPSVRGVFFWLSA